MKCDPYYLFHLDVSSKYYTVFYLLKSFRTQVSLSAIIFNFTWETLLTLHTKEKISVVKREA